MKLVQWFVPMQNSSSKGMEGPSLTQKLHFCYNFEECFFFFPEVFLFSAPNNRESGQNYVTNRCPI